MNSLKKRYDYIDLLKFISMLMVVSLHVSLWNTNFVEKNQISVFAQYCIRLTCEGVPIFIFINGFLTITKEVNIKKHMLKLFKILLLIFIWSCISFIVINLFIHNEPIKLNNIINNLFYTNINNFYNGHLWFLQGLFMLYLVYPIVNYIFKENKKLYYYLFVVVTIFTFLTPFLFSINSIISNNYINGLIIFINRINPINNIFLFYFMLGGVVLDKKEKILNHKIIFIFVSIFTYAFSIIFTYIIFKYKNTPFISNYIYGRLSMAIIVIGLFNLCSFYKNKNNILNKYIQSVSKSTMGIYVIHFPICKILNHYYFHKTNGLFSRSLYFIAIFNISFLLVYLIRQIPYVKKTITL